jgi:hypothetical protein
VIVIRKTQWGWSAFEGGLIASSTRLGELVEYLLTLKPGQIIIETGDK